VLVAESRSTRDAFLLKLVARALLLHRKTADGLLNMTGIGGEKFDIGVIPTAFITVKATGCCSACRSTGR